MSFLKKKLYFLPPQSRVLIMTSPLAQGLLVSLALPVVFTFRLVVNIKSVQSTLSHLITTSVPRAMLTHLLVEHELSQYYLY